MRYRSFVVTVMAGMLLLGACRNEPPPPPAPTGPTEAELAQRRADSIARVRAEEEARRRAEEEARAAEARRRAVEAARTTLRQTVYFDYDMSEIRPDAERVLQQKVAILRNSPQVRMQIEGHADERGSNEYNLALGNRRAQAVVDFFVNFGLDASRFSIISYGEERPAAMGHDEAAWSQNRRAEFNITAGMEDINPGNTP